MTDKQEIQALLEKRQALEVTENNPSILQYLRLRKKQYTIEVKPFPLGVIWQITEQLMAVEDNLPDKNSSVKELAAFIHKNKHIVEKVIAYALNCNSDQEPPEHLFSFIRRNIPGNQIGNVFMFIIVQADLGNFTSAIRLATRKLVASSEAEPKSSE